MIVLFPEFDCFRICRNITMHRPSCIDLAMLVCHGQWLPGSAERLLLNNPALAWRRSPTIKTTAANHVVESYKRWPTHFHMYRQFAKNVPNIQGEDITCMTHWQNCLHTQIYPAKTFPFSNSSTLASVLVFFRFGVQLLRFAPRTVYCKSRNFRWCFIFGNFGADNFYR